jgi:hypothetical protein
VGALPGPRAPYFFGFPFGITVVMGGMGRSEVESFGGEVSFFGFFAILLLRCSPFGMEASCAAGPCNVTVGRAGMN